MTPPDTCILTGTIENPPGTPVAGALVRVRTVAPQLLNNGAGAVVNDVGIEPDGLRGARSVHRCT